MTIIPKDSINRLNSISNKQNVSKSHRKSDFQKVLNESNTKINPDDKLKNQKVSALKGKEKTEISDTSKEIMLAKKAIDESPDIREDLVASIKEQIKNGTYEMDLDKTADSLLKSGVFNDLF
jgi:negative regulator of flagellin synthesis FlgM